MPAEREAQISQLALGQVEQLFDAVFDFDSIDDLRTWLANHPPDTTSAE